MKTVRKITIPVFIACIVLLFSFNLHSGSLSSSSHTYFTSDTPKMYYIQWNRTYIFVRDIFTSKSVIQTTDGNYLVIGTRHPTLSEGCCPLPQSDIFLMKTHPDGAIEWFKIYGDDNIAMDIGYFLVETDDGYVLAGRTNGPPAIGLDFMILHTDFEGRLKWRTVYNKSTEGEIRSFIKTSDNGFALLGISSTNDTKISSNEAMWLIKTDSEGEIEWNQTYDQNFTDFTSMIQIEDDGFIIASYDGELLKITDKGDLQWEKDIPGKLFSIIDTQDGLTLFGSRLNQPWLVKTDYLGNIVWNKTFAFNITGNYIFSHERSQILNLIQSSDGGFLLTGSSVNVPSDGIIKNSNLWLVKTNRNGDLEWSHEFDIETFASIRAIMQDSEGDIVLVGEMKRYIWIVKVDLPPFATIESSISNNPDLTISIKLNDTSSTTTEVDENTSFPSVFLVFLVVSTAVLIRRRKTKF
ncbi:MAG: hypothetical protein ACFFFH_14020 [Candidatus Thorarchaeota archaeon]